MAFSTAHPNLRLNRYTEKRDMTEQTERAMAAYLEFFAQELSSPLEPYYLSFSGEEGFRGAAIVMAHGPTTATAVCHKLGINPGGEVAVLKSPKPVLPELMNRLLSKQELAAAFGPLVQVPKVGDI